MAMVDKETVRASSRLEDVVPALLGTAVNWTNGSREPVIRCPFHEDGRASLRVNIEKQVWHCDPCGFGGDVFELVQRVRKVEFADALRWLADRSSAMTTTERKIVATYDYHDEHGAMLYQVVRFQPKDFRQRQPDGNGGWNWKMKGVRRVLYRLDKLQKREAAVIVEGEKDADALWSLSLPATTSVGGAGKWTDDYAQQLVAAGVKRIVVVPDSDAPGRDHAASIARSCQATGIDVRTLDLPGVPAKGDVSDYLGSHSKDELVALLKGAPQFSPPGVAAPSSTRTEPAKKDKPLAAGQGVDFNDPEPWPTSVDGKVLLDSLRAFLLRYAVLTPESADAIVLWIVHSYLMTVWRISPFAVANSPTKQCGKTKLLEVVSALVFRALPTSNITPAALFRVIDKFTPTLLFDEAENWITDKASELRGLLNAGHTRRTAKAIRTVGDKHEVACFSTWAPKFIALIGALPDTMMDRSIVIPMRRKRKDESVEVLLAHRLEADTAPLRRQIIRFADDHAERLAATVPTPVQGLRDRAVDNWSPLFAIADIAGRDWPARALKAASVLSGGSEASDDSPGLQLLEDCYGIWREQGADAGVIGSLDLVKRLKDLPERPWGDYHGGKGITPAWLAKRLKDFDVVGAGNVRFDGKQCKGYRWATFTDAWERYAVPQSYQRTEANKHGPESTDRSRPAKDAGTDAKTEIPPINPGLWDGGTAESETAGAVDGWGEV